MWMFKLEFFMNVYWMKGRKGEKERKEEDEEDEDG